MPASSNFQNAIREAQSSALVGPNVVNKALPYVGGGMVLTAAGVLGGISTYASIGGQAFQTLSFIAIIPWFILFFVAQNAAQKANNSTALPLLATFSLVTGFTLTGVVLQAVAVVGSAWAPNLTKLVTLLLSLSLVCSGTTLCARIPLSFSYSFW